MALVSVSEAARLVCVSRPTIYKMLHSGALNYTSTVKHGKPAKAIDTSELIRVFGSVSGVKMDVKNDTAATSVDRDDLQNLQHQLAMLRQENDGLRNAVNARDEHITSLRQAMLLLEHRPEPRPPWWKFWKR